ncbi:MAG: glucose-6-phosphate isomerase family protein [bacterium]|nr:glucose-6-phosphate isomerase family protein [bacterium]
MRSEIKPDIRYLKDLKDVIFDKKSVEMLGKKTELYYMYRGLKFFGKIRYDITVIPGLMIGKEFNRTLGHFHKENFKEIYRVLEGTAIFYFQDKTTKKIKAIKAKKNDLVVISPEFGHIAINPSEKLLVLSNLTPDIYKSDYEIFKKLKGPAYFYTKTGWVKNKNYKNPPKIKFEKPLKNLPKNWKKILG